KRVRPMKLRSSTVDRVLQLSIAFPQRNRESPPMKRIDRTCGGPATCKSPGSAKAEGEPSARSHRRAARAPAYPRNKRGLSAPVLAEPGLQPIGIALWAWAGHARPLQFRSPSRFSGGFTLRLAEPRVHPRARVRTHWGRRLNV